MEGGIQRPLRLRALLPPCSDEALVRSFQIGIVTAWCTGQFGWMSTAKRQGIPLICLIGLGEPLDAFILLGPCFWAIPRPGPSFEVFFWGTSRFTQTLQTRNKREWGDAPLTLAPPSHFLYLL